jgi:hypothetical protein
VWKVDQSADGDITEGSEIDQKGPLGHLTPKSRMCGARWAISPLWEAWAAVQPITPMKRRSRQLPRTGSNQMDVPPSRQCGTERALRAVIMRR